jgi:hypothetical protein
MAIKSTKTEVPTERTRFKRLLAANPNYFGNLVESPFKPVKKIVANTQYEELTCVGFNPDTKCLEATVAVKLRSGYGGDLCQLGSTEYVRFFVNYGSGWEDAGLAGVGVHDIPDETDCAHNPNKPLTYVATLKYEPKTDCCPHPVLPRVRAILSWQWVPPVGPANVGWLPPWGNVVECNIQIKPRPWDIICILEEIEKSVGQKIKIPPLFEAAKGKPIPLPDPPPLTLAALAKLYTAKASATAYAKRFSVEPHRFGITHLDAVTSTTGFDEKLVEAKMAEFKVAGINLAELLAALDDTKANVTYEELECVGLDETFPERLVATFRIKRPAGYSGDLCQKGSIEYVAFWADWENTCEWTYVGTAQVNIHDIATIPKEGLCYSAILPVDLTYHRRACDKPKVGRVRAVLSWAMPPSTTNPDALNYWGNRLDSHVLINPGDEVHPGEPPVAKIRNIGGIPIEDINTAGNGMTIPSAVFAHFPWITADQWGLGRACPFGRRVVIEGNYYVGYFYRVKVHRVGDPPASFTTLTTSFSVERSDFGFDLQTAMGGFFPYLDPVTHFDRTLALWDTVVDELWEVQLDIATAPSEVGIIASSPWYRIQLDNTAPAAPPASPPTIDIHIAAGGDCKDFTEGATITGTFIADDLHFGGWSLSTEPNTISTPSNQPIVSGLANTDPAPAPGGHAWSLDSGSPIKMKPCGYVVRLDVSDRTIVSSYPGSHNWNHIEVGFCLREKK